MSFMETFESISGRSRILGGQVADLSAGLGRGFAWYMLRYSDHMDGRTLTFHKSACQEMRTVNAVD